MQNGKYFLLETVFLFIIMVSILGCDSASSDNSIITSREECLGVPDCTSVAASELETIKGEGIHSLHFVCPDEAPNIHNIDVDRNDNITFQVFNWSENGVSVFFKNQDPERVGIYQPFLGCSSEPFTSGERFDGSVSLPNIIPDVPSDPPPGANNTNARFETPDACDSSIPECLNVLSGVHRIGHLKTHIKHYKCPDSHPWYAAWNSSVTSGAVIIIEDSIFSKLRFEGRGNLFSITNLSLIHDHHWEIAIACSKGCDFAPGGCPCGKGKFGCRNDPGCKTTMSRRTECTPDESSCWSVWEETCMDGDVWECNTTLIWTCCETCQ
jgi:hypothetical protein